MKKFGIENLPSLFQGAIGELSIPKKNYAGFKGRARRKEFWMFNLFAFILAIAASLLDGLIGTYDETYNTGYIYVFVLLATFIPSLAVSVRRLHDTGKSGWMILLIFIPILGALWLIVLFCDRGDIGLNKYGEDPKISENLMADFA